MLNSQKSALLAIVVMFSMAALAQTETQSKAPSIAVNSVYKGYRILYEDEEGVFLAEKSSDFMTSRRNLSLSPWITIICL
jgi:hypothetical protein